MVRKRLIVPKKTKYYEIEESYQYPGKMTISVQMSELEGRVEYSAKRIWEYGTVTEREQMAKILEKAGDQLTKIAARVTARKQKEWSKR